jgi:protein N-terminal methyltransferase
METRKYEASCSDGVDIGGTEFVQDASAHMNHSVPSTVGFTGTDSDGNFFGSVEEMWESQGVEVGAAEASSSTWYLRAASYYNDNCPSTIDGVLGGFASITQLDLQGSLDFLQELSTIQPTVKQWTIEKLPLKEQESTSPALPGRRACECGAGIGRVSKGLLLSLPGIDFCDLVESSPTLIGAAPEYLGNLAAGRCRFFCTGLQDWLPTPQTYTIIWIQWVLSYLTDDDIIYFLRRCGESLVADGVIVLKENTCTDVDFEVDSEDASVTRSLRYWKYLVQQAGLRIIFEKMQDGLPDEIYPVPMLAFDVPPS